MSLGIGQKYVSSIGKYFVKAINLPKKWQKMSNWQLDGIVFPTVCLFSECSEKTRRMPVTSHVTFGLFSRYELFLECDVFNMFINILVKSASRRLDLFHSYKTFSIAKIPSFALSSMKYFSPSLEANTLMVLIFFLNSKIDVSVYFISL